MCTDNQLDRLDAEKMEEYIEMVFVYRRELVLSLINMLTFISFHILL